MSILRRYGRSIVAVSVYLTRKSILDDNDAVSVLRRYLLNIVAVSAIFTFKFILLDNEAVSIFLRYGVSIDVVSAIFTLRFILLESETVSDAPNLLLNVLQLADDNAPRFVADAVGKLNLCVVPVDTILKSVLSVPVTIVCAAPVKELIAVIPVPAIIPLCCVTVKIADGIAG